MSVSHHVDQALEDFCETLKWNIVNPATSQPFTITSEAKEIYDERKDSYHLITSNILWIMKHSQTDLETAVSFI